MQSLTEKLLEVLCLIGEHHRLRLRRVHFDKDGRPAYRPVEWLQEQDEWNLLRGRLNDLLAALERQRGSCDLLHRVVKAVESVQGFWDSPNQPRGRKTVANELEAHIEAMLAAGRLLFEADDDQKTPTGKRGGKAKAGRKPSPEVAEVAVETSSPSGKPGRPAKTRDIAKFANTLRKRKQPKSWSDILVDWKAKHPDDDRVKDWQAVREAWRRHFGDKAR